MIVPSAGVSSLSDLPALAASRALVSNASGVIDVSAATATEAGYLSGVTSAIQPQLDGKQPLDADLTSYAGAADAAARRDLIGATAGVWPVSAGGTGASSFAANRVPHMNSANTALTSTNNFDIDTNGYFRAPQVVGVNGIHVATATGSSRCIDYTGSTLIVGSTAYTTTNIKAGTATLLNLDSGTNSVNVNGGLKIAAWGFVSYVSGSNFRFGGISGHSGPWAGVEFYASGSEVARLTSGGLIIGGTSLDSSAALQVNSTTRGILPSRMTSTQRGLIASPAEGLVVYDTTLARNMIYSDGAWVAVTAGRYGYECHIPGSMRVSTGTVENVDINPAEGYALKSDIGCIQLPSGEAYYLGDKDTDGSWRHIRSGNNLLFQRRESDSWVTKQTISA